MTIRFKRLFALIFLLGSLHQQTFAQSVNYIINPNTDGGFEGAHGWTFLNGIQANQWQVGPAVKSAGSNGAYVSNNASTQTLTSPQAGNSIVYMYKDIAVPSNATSINLSFKWKTRMGLPSLRAYCSCRFRICNTYLRVGFLPNEYCCFSHICKTKVDGRLTRTVILCRMIVILLIYLLEDII